MSKVNLPKLGSDFAIFLGIQRGTKVNYHPETPKGPSDIILMAVQFYACSSLFTPLYPEKMARDALITKIIKNYQRGYIKVTYAASHAFVSRLQSAHKADCRRRGGLSNFGTF